jgi:hypothetical protein
MTVVSLVLAIVLHDAHQPCSRRYVMTCMCVCASACMRCGCDRVQAVRVACGVAHTAIVTASGRVYAWGKSTL